MKKVPTYYSLKAIVASIGLFWAFNCLGQNYTYVYTFRIPSVTNLAEAKDITAPLRRLFNDPANPFATYPTFNDERDEFHFNCPLAVGREQLEQALSGTGLTVTEFKSLRLVEGETYNSNEH